MSPSEIEDDEDAFTSLLAAADEALAAGRPMPSAAVADPERLERVLACVRLLRAGGASTEDSTDTLPPRIGRFLIHRELGRGGFGIVLLASDPTTNREVALKVPRADVLVTPELRERFQREARAAASLDHPNIVPVYEAGQAGPISYIAAAYCPGPTLADWLRQRAKPVRFVDAARFIALLAGAVQHAHDRGVLHRDLKPANILLQDSRIRDQEPRAADRPQQDTDCITDAADTAILSPDSCLLTARITDFGLAKLLDAAESGPTCPTRSGAVLGTPGYMAPEQAGAHGLAPGPATDVYGLGAILYELLTGRPPFRGDSDLETLLQVRNHDPIAPSRLRTQTPRDLETICLKCLAKVPGRRYANAGDLAADLTRWLGNEPIRARPPSAVYRLRKYGRRNRTALAIAGSLLLAIVFAAGIVGWSARDQVAQRAALDREIGRALEDAEAAYERDQLSEADAAVRRAEGLLATGHPDPQTAQRVKEWRTDLEMLARLENIRLEYGSLNERPLAKTDWRYAQAFADYGIDVENLPPGEATARLQDRRIKVELAAALDGWATTRRRAGEPEARWQPLLEMASACDPDPWRVRLRAALTNRDRAGLVQLAADEQVRTLTPRTLVTFGDTLRGLGAVNEATTLLRGAQQRYPGDFWINCTLAWCLTQMRPAQNDQAIRFYTAALALRGHLPVVHHNLGVVLIELNHLDEAEHAFREAIRLNPDFAEGHNGLGVALARKKMYDDAIGEFHEASRIRPEWFEPHVNLGLALHGKGRKDEALASMRRAVELGPNESAAYFGLGWISWDLDLVDEAVSAYRQVIGLRADHARAHGNLGQALASQGHVAEAIVSFNRALRLKPDLSAANVNLAVLLANGPDPKLRDVTRALELARRAASDRQNLWALGVVYYRAGMYSAAAQNLEDWMKQRKSNHRARFFLAMAHQRLGNNEKARRHYDEACRELTADSLQRKQDKAYREELSRLRLEAAELLGIPAKDRAN